MSEQDEKTAAAAVLVQSEPMPADAIKVEGTDFTRLQKESVARGSGITVDELLSSMATTGFQATSLGKAVEVIEQMVRDCRFPV